MFDETLICKTQGSICTCANARATTRDSQACGAKHRVMCSSVTQTVTGIFHVVRSEAEVQSRKCCGETVTWKHKLPAPFLYVSSPQQGVRLHTSETLLLVCHMQQVRHLKLYGQKPTKPAFFEVPIPCSKYAVTSPILNVTPSFFHNYHSSSIFPLTCS